MEQSPKSNCLQSSRLSERSVVVLTTGMSMPESSTSMTYADIVDLVVSRQTQLAGRLSVTLYSRTEGRRSRKGSLQAITALVERNIHNLLTGLQLGVPVMNGLNDDALEAGNRFIPFADDDLAVLDSLRRGRHWSSVIYHLQQAAEKITTALVVGTGMIEQDSRMLRGHNIPERVIHLLEIRTGKDQMQLAGLVLNKNYPKAVSRLNQIIRDPEPVIRTWGLDKIRHMLYVLTKLGQGQKAIPGVDDLFRLQEEIFREVFPELEYEAAILGRGEFTDSMRSILRCYLTGLMLSPHVNTTRYPNEGLPHTYYTRHAPIVQASRDIEQQIREMRAETVRILDWVHHIHNQTAD